MVFNMYHRIFVEDDMLAAAERELENEEGSLF